ncbi:LPS export ABC transporter permease LptG [Suttonella sp. R2A3]|uniref:LPS export ABC transporter permease LptG n=1 Tax=Suttonella sp. R2A3 TaxID=2908648 RepID=UPI001F19305C|nr:LPS export ABC transporter permease LptG [Suttonella sp. R2A3]UJF23981.1 LPS export ABC transporter permease LptG [Suttonella sp. R2A3]
MNRFDRYVLRTLLGATAIALIFLLGIDILIQSADDVDNIGKGQYSVGTMLLVQLYNLPQRIVLFAPAAVLIGGIMGLGQLGSQNELTVVQACGVSRLRLARSGLLLAALLGMALLVVGETLSPQASAKGDLLRAQALGRSAALSSDEGLWLNSSGVITRIGKLNEDGSLGRLTFFQREEGNSIQIALASRATYQDGGWQLNDYRGSRLDPQAMDALPAQSTWQTNLQPKDLSLLAEQNQFPSLSERYRQTQFLRANGLNYRAESLALWQKLLLPLSTCTMLLLALPFAFNHGRSANQGSRLVVGILIGVSYYVVEGIAGNLSLLLGAPPLLGALLPITLFALLPIYLLHR